jgi:hypothetical protein
MGLLRSGTRFAGRRGADLGLDCGNPQGICGQRPGEVVRSDQLVGPVDFALKNNQVGAHGWQSWCLPSGNRSTAWIGRSHSPKRRETASSRASSGGSNRILRTNEVPQPDHLNVAVGFSLQPAPPDLQGVVYYHNYSVR